MNIEARAIVLKSHILSGVSLDPQLDLPQSKIRLLEGESKTEIGGVKLLEIIESRYSSNCYEKTKEIDQLRGPNPKFFPKTMADQDNGVSVPRERRRTSGTIPFVRGSSSLTPHSGLKEILCNPGTSYWQHENGGSDSMRDSSEYPPT